jgi:hypothetical protein
LTANLGSRGTRPCSELVVWVSDIIGCGLSDVNAIALVPCLGWRFQYDFEGLHGAAPALLRDSEIVK